MCCSDYQGMLGESNCVAVLLLDATAMQLVMYLDLCRM